ncbi:MAG: DUF2628 domain-containing protein [Notoacmeibacter sp.]|nr:DUF2628 domain-containing protein [Notoacmeibacter sp.]
MASWVIMEKPDERAGDGTLLVRDGFSFVAFIVPLLWLLWHRLWIEALVLLAVAAGIAAASTFGGLAGAEPFVSVLVSLFIGLEGPNLRLRALARRGWREAGVVEAASRDEAEYRWFGAERSAGEPSPAAPRAAQPSRSAAAVPTIGMVEFPGAR